MNKIYIIYKEEKPVNITEKVFNKKTLSDIESIAA